MRKDLRLVVVVRGPIVGASSLIKNFYRWIRSGLPSLNLRLQSTFTEVKTCVVFE